MLQKRCFISLRGLYGQACSGNPSCRLWYWKGINVLLKLNNGPSACSYLHWFYTEMKTSAHIIQIITNFQINQMIWWLSERNQRYTTKIHSSVRFSQEITKYLDKKQCLRQVQVHVPTVIYHKFLSTSQCHGMDLWINNSISFHLIDPIVNIVITQITFELFSICRMIGLILWQSTLFYTIERPF